jgi:hypothetical protein
LSKNALWKTYLENFSKLRQQFVFRHLDFGFCEVGFLIGCFLKVKILDSCIRRNDRKKRGEKLHKKKNAKSQQKMK